MAARTVLLQDVARLSCQIGIGVGRLSSNWLLAKICAWYVEAFRNVPLLLWLFLFYKLISEAFPGPRQAIGAFWNSVYLSNRGLYFPVPLTDPGTEPIREVLA